MNFDIVLVTYERVLHDYEVLSEVRASFEKQYLDQESSECTLAVMSRHVAIFDEAHRMCNSETQTFAAMDSLSTKYRLPITGTPFQNERSDIQSMFKFLGVQPWCDKQLFERVSLHHLVMSIHTNMYSITY